MIVRQNSFGGQKYADQKKKRANMKFNFVHFKINQCTVYLDWICF